MGKNEFNMKDQTEIEHLLRSIQTYYCRLAKDLTIIRQDVNTCTSRIIVVKQEVRDLTDEIKKGKWPDKEVQLLINRMFGERLKK